MSPMFFMRNLSGPTRIKLFILTNPVTLDLANKTFDKVFCFDQSGGTQFQDKTTEAANTTTADIFPTTSNGLVKDINDILYLGTDSKFDSIRSINFRNYRSGFLAVLE